MLTDSLQEQIDVTEFIKLLKEMNNEDRQQVKGIMIGIKLSKELLVTKTA